MKFYTFFSKQLLYYTIKHIFRMCFIVFFIYNRWIVECAKLFVETKENCRDILPTQGIKPSKYQIQKFFDCVAATMSRQLREIVFKSLKHFMSKILEYKVRI